MISPIVAIIILLKKTLEKLRRRTAVDAVAVKKQLRICILESGPHIAGDKKLIILLKVPSISISLQYIKYIRHERVYTKKFSLS